MYRSTFTICFENGMWSGYFEENDNGVIKVYRHVFGPEPSEAEIYQFISKNYLKILDFLEKNYSGVSVEEKPIKKINPKRKLREIQKSKLQKPLSTLSQDIIRIQREEMKVLKKKTTKEVKELQEKELWSKKVLKKKEKRKGH